MDAIWVHIGIRGQNIRFRALGYCNDCVRIEDRRLLHPRAHRVTAAELFRLPGAQRLQRVRGQDKRNAVELLGKIPCHRHIPRVRMNNVNSAKSLDLCEIQAEGFQRSLELALSPVGNLGPRLGSAHMQIALVGLLRPPAVHLNLDLLGHLAAQVLDVDSRSSINLRRVLARE